MKKLIKFTGLVVLCLAFFNSQAFAQTTEVKIKTSAICDECKDRIEKALAFEKGIKSSNVDLKDQLVTVVYYPKRTSPEKIKEAISNAGYDADEIPAKKESYEKLPTCCKKTDH